MRKEVLIVLLSISITNGTFAKIGSIGLQKIKSSIIDSLKNSKKLDKNSFKKYVEESKKRKELDPKTQLADIIQVSNGSTIKGLPKYTSKTEKEISEQIKYSNDLINNFIKWANQFELVDMMENEHIKGNQFDILELFAQKLNERYQDKKTMFTDFATDLTEEQKNLIEQTEILEALKDIPEAKNNDKLSEKINITLSMLSKLKNNLYKLIEKTNNLATNSIGFLSAWLQMSSDQQTQNISSNIIGNIIEPVVDTMTDGITELKGAEATKEIVKQTQLDDEPEIITDLPDIKHGNPPIEAGVELTYQPFKT